MSKYDVLVDVAKKISALDNDVKLKILALLIEEGSKSITDISKELGMNFSTAHKYLEQLEAADLVASKEVSENRLKRLFTIRDFDIELSPKGISEMINGKNGKKSGETKKCLKVINEDGELAEFDEKLFAQKYLKRGMPQGTIVSALNATIEQAYDGITLLELRRIFRNELEKKIENVKSVFEQIGASDMHKRTFTHLLEMVHPEALEMHANGDIFIKNLSEPKLLNFVHDLRGIISHGIDEKPSENMQDLFKQTLSAIKKSADFVRGPHAFDAFNFFVAPLVKNTSNTRMALKSFFDSLAEINSVFYVNLDAGLPKYAENYFAMFGGKGEFYKNYVSQASQILGETIDILKASKHKNIIPVIKIWDKKLLNKSLGDLQEFIILNLTKNAPDNVSIISNIAFDSSWRGVQRTSRVGELQDISINLARIALKTKNENDFIVQLKKIVEDCIEFHLNIMELSIGEFLRKYQVSHKTIFGQRWPYAAINDCIYSISLVGMNDTIEILKIKDEKFAEKVLRSCEGIISKFSASPIRLNLKEESADLVIKRFRYLDSKMFDLNIKQDSDYKNQIKGKYANSSYVLPKKEFGKYLLEFAKTDVPVRFV